jgi:hypothetical protein
MRRGITKARKDKEENNDNTDPHTRIVLSFLHRASLVRKKKKKWQKEEAEEEKKEWRRKRKRKCRREG